MSRGLPSPPSDEVVAEDPDPDVEGWLEVESGEGAETGDDTAVVMVLPVNDEI
jgi:hypothetical protein